MEKAQTAIDYNRIADAIGYYKANFKDQPSLEQVAEHVHLSPFHFQRMFHEWAGVTPKQFLQYLTLEHAKNVLKNPSGATLSDAAYEAGLSGTGRLHDLFIKIEGMTPGEYKKGGEALHISYSFAESPFGRLLVASTEKGICYMAFADGGDEAGPDDGDEAALDDGGEAGPDGGDEAALRELKKHFPHARYRADSDEQQRQALSIFTKDWSQPGRLRLHLKGTPFQIKVWETLLKIPMGGLTTYAGVAGKIDDPKAVRAVGTAIAKNPVALLIPCHRVIRSDGRTGEYHWGDTRKNAIIGWEAAKTWSFAS